MTIRPARPDDLDFFVACVTREGWLSETRASFETFFAHDPKGCFVAEQDGQAIGMIVATPYDTCGFLGELIVLPEHRGHGLGRQLMEHAIGYLRASVVGQDPPVAGGPATVMAGVQDSCPTESRMDNASSIYLDGDTPAVPLYERIGFCVICKSLRFLGRIEPAPDDSVRPMTTTDLDTILTLDRAAFGADRSFFLKRRLATFPNLCHVIDDSGIVGYIMGQPGHGVVTVGPWYVRDDLVDPLSLLRAIALNSPEAKLRVGILESSEYPVELMRSMHSFTETEPSWRMVLGPDIGLGASERLYAIGSPATG